MYGEEGEDFMRWNIACPQTLLKEGLEKFCKFVHSLYLNKSRADGYFFCIKDKRFIHHLAVCPCSISLPEMQGMS